MKILNTKSLFVLLHALFFLVACDFTMVRELDIERLDFPPKLSVTAILDGRTGVFDITLMEGNSLAKSQRVRLKYDNIRSGEIRLFEDGALLLSIPGPFDMSTDITQFGDNWRWGQNGFSRRLSGVATRPGSVYRLEVDVEGYPMAVSTSVMPAAPAVWAGMDTSAQVLMNGVREIGTVGYGLNNIGNQNWNESYPNRYWPVSVRVEVPDMNHYLALYVNKNELSMLGNRGYAWGIGASDLSILLEDGMDGELLSGEYVDLY
ncbi:MAG: hypothetical protein FWE30_00175, partial [Bacteroidales bacterium]|nr:hypothetical protein [Bacteroidales bacterium]